MLDNGDKRLRSCAALISCVSLVVTKLAPDTPFVAAMAEDTAFDDLFNYDAGIEELLRDPEEEKNDRRASGTGTGSTENKNDDLIGLEEIKITRKRAPPVKLDENRLLPRRESLSYEDLQKRS
ncbi:hypothetical protein CIHG_08418 [Coccidioides immitis H538.4]|uniref:Uncharacterized protein n=1 Tax=Coccidioides immitis H538.4 TaxID=396776 RepID=A0A0J8S2F4_COCIT|nr:hypothetical protein CIHG_08418 [Coccidioides immitis H538.4]